MDMGTRCDRVRSVLADGFYDLTVLSACLDEASEEASFQDAILGIELQVAF